MPTTSQPGRIPANARLITSVRIQGEEVGVTVTHLRSSVRRATPTDWVTYSRELADGSTKWWAEQRTGRSSAKIAAELQELVTQARTDGHTVTVLADETDLFTDLESVVPHPLQRPTLPDKIDGIVGWNPVQLQCRDCGAIHTGTRPDKPGFDILVAGFRFHVCEGPTGKRRCPACLATVHAACPRDHS